jgi:glucosylceramidase
MSLKTKNSIETKYRKGILLVMLVCLGFYSSYSCKSEEGKNDPVDPIDTTQVPVRTDITCWLTKPDKSALLKKQDVSLLFTTEVNQNPTISVDTTITYQEIDGFGFALTGGSAYLINRMDAAKRDALLKELFSSDSNSIGISYIRVSIGASDLSSTVFSYDDMPSGQTDVNLDHFSLAPEEVDLLPVLKSIVLINPKIKILGSPWSAPVWMKSNKNSVGGSLLPEYYDAYARYLTRYVTEMKVKGITIDAITPQNEPLNPNNNPSMVMQATEQRDFIKNNLGPAFQAANLTTKIIVYDHNCDRPDYVTTILSDPDAAKYVDGSAFHLYAGDISALSQVHNAYPAKNVYFTEQWVGGPSNFSGDLQWHTQNLIIGATRNWSRNVLEWNLASDASYYPHTDGGCTQCEGALTLINSTIYRNVSYYIIAHASKFVPAGSVRISSTVPANLPNVAFRTPDGHKVLIVLNNSSAPVTFNLAFNSNSKHVVATLSNGSVATYIW